MLRVWSHEIWTENTPHSSSVYKNVHTSERLEVTGKETAFHLSFLPAFLMEISVHSFHSLIQCGGALFLCQACAKLRGI